MEALRELPKAWVSVVSFEPSELPRLGAKRFKGTGRTERVIHIVNGAALAFANTLEVATAMRAEYLLRAVDFCGAELVTVWREGRGAKHELEPLVFSAGTANYQKADRIAIVMPCRK